MKNFFINLSVITAITGAVTFFVTRSFPQIEFLLSTFLCMYFFLITLLSHYAILSAVPADTTAAGTASNYKFVNRYLITTVSKFFFSVLILVGYVFLNKDNAVPFIILFACYYFIFSAFEIFSLVKFFRKGKQV